MKKIPNITPEVMDQDNNTLKALNIGLNSALVDCNYCKHYDGKGSYTCPAYPEMIPTDVWYGDVLHNVVLSDQTDIFVFELDTDKFKVVGSGELAKYIPI